MTRHPSHIQNNRRGAVAVLACFLMIALLAMLAFAIDLGYLANSQAELQRSADAAALAACYELVYQGTPGTPVNLSTNVLNVPTVAGQYAALNHVCGSAPSLATGDVVVGYMADPTQPGGTIDTSANQNGFNAVQVTVRRSSSENGKVPSFFGRVFGSQGESTSASAIAALLNNFGGFQAPSTNGGNTNLMILPYALDQLTWNALQAGDTTVTTDVWNYNTSGQVVSGSDGIREVNLFPQGTGSPGNRGTVYIGNAKGTADLVQQILYGISPSDLAVYGGQLKFDSSGNLYLSAKPGISAGTKSALASIIGQTRLIPIFASLTGNGANASYDIVMFVGIRVMDVNLTGSMSSKHLTVQPALVYTRGGIPSTSSSTRQSYGAYSPVWLAR
ncbi:MAG TPA: pilus assembly protein TadG-related protein [Pirellulales bacterium]|nr:pilus assembly protein TadG-related protein [Pirellulales bacterium]